MEIRKLEAGLFFLAVVVFCVAYTLGAAERENGKCVLNCIEFNADTPEELNDPKLLERCEFICEKGLEPWAEFDTPLDLI